jgi:hypothetical protein
MTGKPRSPVRMAGNRMNTSVSQKCTVKTLKRFKNVHFALASCAIDTLGKTLYTGAMPVSRVSLKL